MEASAYLLVHSPNGGRCLLCIAEVSQGEGAERPRGARAGLEVNRNRYRIKCKVCRTREGSEPRPSGLGRWTQGNTTGTGQPSANDSSDTY